MPVTVVVGPNASEIERFAATELRRYLHAATGELAEIQAATDNPAPGVVFHLGTAGDHAGLNVLVDEQEIEAPTAPESYLVRTLPGATGIVVVGADPQGVLYGTYRLLETYGIRFYLGRDAIGPCRAFTVPEVDLAERPSVRHRGLLPWHDFLCGPSGYSFADFRRYLDQMAKMRMNTLVLHNYAGGYPGRDINEPFMSFEYRGIGYDGYLDSSVDNQRWGLATTTADDMAFRAGDLMPYDVMASDAARMTWGQPDERENTFAKGKTMMRQIIAYARSRGIEVVLGTDFDLVPLALAEAGCDPLSSEVLFARIDDIIRTYPTLNYIQLYYSESHQVTTEQAIEAYRLVRDYLSKVASGVRLLTGSWFQEERFGEMHERLQDDVIFSSLLPHDMTVKDDWAAMTAAGRETWAVPWMEIDGGLSEPQVIVARMRDQLPRLRAAGVSGVIGILWREQAVEMNVSYLAADAWQDAGSAIDPDDFYRDYAESLYGRGADGSLPSIAAEALRNLEGASVYGTWTNTNQFFNTPDPVGMTTPEFGTWYFSGSKKSAEIAAKWHQARLMFDRALAAADDPAGRFELTYWTQGLRWLEFYWRTHETVPAAAEISDPLEAWEALVHSGFREAIETYAHMVRDWTGLGGLVSAAGGRWFYADPPPPREPINEQFRVFENRIRARLDVQPPDLVRAHGGADGVHLEWRRPAVDEAMGFDEAVAGYHLYRAPLAESEFVRITETPVSGFTYTDPVSGSFRYRISTVTVAGGESPGSLVDTATAGTDDTDPPWVQVMPSPPTAVAGQPLPVAATVVSGRAAGELSAALSYRAIGATEWTTMPMRTNVTGRGRTFYADVPAELINPDGVEYIISGKDRPGDALATAPVGAPDKVFTVVGVPPSGGTPKAPEGLRGVRADSGATLEWRLAESAGVQLYRIYRAEGETARTDSAHYLTYVAARQTEFHDHTFTSSAPVTYVVTAVSLAGVASEPAVVVI